MDKSAKRYDFKGVWVPKDIWLNKQIPPQAKMIFIEINALDRDFGCVAGNDHFGEMFGIQERQVRRHIKFLKDAGLIDVTLNKRNDTRTIRVLGKYRRISDAELDDPNFTEKDLARIEEHMDNMRKSLGLRLRTYEEEE